MDGLHLRTGGRAFVREAGDRRLFAEVLRWDKPVRLSMGGMEWFTRDREPPREAAVLALLHGGRRAGQVIEWRSSVLGLDAVLLADESMIGDGLLGLVDKHGELPVSPSFRGTGAAQHRRSVAQPVRAGVGGVRLGRAAVGPSAEVRRMSSVRWRVKPCVGMRGKAGRSNSFRFRMRDLGSACAPPDPVVKNDSRGHRIVKQHKDSTRRIDLAVAAVMAHAVASTAEPGPQVWVFDEAEASYTAIR